MALLRGKLLAGALFAGALFAPAPQQVVLPELPATATAGGYLPSKKPKRALVAAATPQKLEGREYEQASQEQSTISLRVNDDDEVMEILVAMLGEVV